MTATTAGRNASLLTASPAKKSHPVFLSYAAGRLWLFERAAHAWQRMYVGGRCEAGREGVKRRAVHVLTACAAHPGAAVL